MSNDAEYQTAYCQDPFWLQQFCVGDVCVGEPGEDGIGELVGFIAATPIKMRVQGEPVAEFAEINFFCLKARLRKVRHSALVTVLWSQCYSHSASLSVLATGCVSTPSHTD